MSTAQGYVQELNEYVKKERAAVKLNSKCGQLLYDKGIELVLFRNHLINTTISEIMNLHEYAGNVVKKPIDVYTTSELAEKILGMDIAPSKIDIGKLADEWLTEKDNFSSMEDFLGNKLSDMVSADFDMEPRDVVLFGFGRIGRLAARELIKQAGKGQQLRLRAIVIRTVNADQIVKRAALLKNDSVHGAFSGTVIPDTDNNAIIINGQNVKIIEAKTPEDVDYTSYGINNALIIDNTGVYKDKEALGRHLQAKGASKVLLTAPGSGIENIVYGINHKDLDIDGQDIFSAASCTTNAISPVLKVMEDTYGVVKGHIETVHAYTNDQNLLDNMHKKPRRGRSAAINMVITSTGAGKAVTKVIPSLENKATSVEEINDKMRDAALNGDLVNQIHYSLDPELVSNDIIGNVCCSVFDSHATIVSNDGKNVVLYAWYDNEFGYTKQVIRLAKYIAKVRRLIYY